MMDPMTPPQGTGHPSTPPDGLRRRSLLAYAVSAPVATVATVAQANRSSRLKRMGINWKGSGAVDNSGGRRRLPSRTKPAALGHAAVEYRHTGGQVDLGFVRPL